MWHSCHEQVLLVLILESASSYHSESTIKFTREDLIGNDPKPFEKSLNKIRSLNIALMRYYILVLKSQPCDFPLISLK